jgi:hypothetical protein
MPVIHGQSAAQGRGQIRRPTHHTGKGQKQHKKQKTLHTDFNKLYGVKKPVIRLDEQEFRLVLVRPGYPNTNFTDRLESVEWRDEGNQLNLNSIPVLRGTINWRRDDPDLKNPRLELRDGDQVRCDVKWLGRWQPLWKMRIISPPQHTLEDGTATAEIADDLILATLSRGDFRYTKGKKHKRRKNGWRYHDIVADVCRRYRIPMGSIVKGKSRIDNLDLKNVSPLEAIRQAVQKEQEHTGLRYVITWRPYKRHGKTYFALNVTHPARNSMLLVMGDQIRAAVSEPTRRAKFATSIIATASQGKKKGKRKKVEVRVTADGKQNRKKGKKPAHSEFDPQYTGNLVRRYGFIERHITVKGDPSQKELRDNAKDALAKEAAQVRVLSNFTHYGVAFVRRGDVERIALPEEGFAGKQAYMFVVSATHTLTPDDYVMTLEMTWRDPLDPNVSRKMRETAQRKSKRQKHGKKTKKKKGHK